ncbi:MAG: hypothetical protein V3S51_03075, partial [Dehalococcoidia bacterium]
MARILKQNVKRLLAEVPDDLVFRCRDGHTLRSIQELEQALVSIADEASAYHSNGEKTDFGNRVKDTIEDEKPARDLWEAPNQTQADQSVASHITFPGTG